jgi:hypothetical protein
MIDLLQGQEAIPDTPTYVMIKVTNRNPMIIRDRFDGVPVEFKPGETVTINKHQAYHFFGFPGTPDEMAVHMAKRFGWNTAEYVMRPPGTMPHEPMLFQKYAAAIHIEAVEMELVPKQKNLADDGLEVTTMPQMEMAEVIGEPKAQLADPSSSKVGTRTGSPVKRKPGRPRKNPQPDFTPLG